MRREERKWVLELKRRVGREGSGGGRGRTLNVGLEGCGPVGEKQVWKGIEEGCQRHKNVNTGVWSEQEAVTTMRSESEVNGERIIECSGHVLSGPSPSEAIRV
jgi:hypothetical protein